VQVLRQQVGEAAVGRRRDIGELPEDGRIELPVEALHIRDKVAGLMWAELEVSEAQQKAKGRIVELEMPSLPTFVEGQTDRQSDSSTLLGKVHMTIEVAFAIDVALAQVSYVRSSSYGPLCPLVAVAALLRSHCL